MSVSGYLMLGFGIVFYKLWQFGGFSVENIFFYIFIYLLDPLTWFKREKNRFHDSFLPFIHLDLLPFLSNLNYIFYTKRKSLGFTREKNSRKMQWQQKGVLFEPFSWCLDVMKKETYEIQHLTMFFFQNFQACSNHRKTRNGYRQPLRSHVAKVLLSCLAKRKKTTLKWSIIVTDFAAAFPRNANHAMWVSFMRNWIIKINDSTTTERDRMQKKKYINIIVMFISLSFSSRFKFKWHHFIVSKNLCFALNMNSSKHMTNFIEYFACEMFVFRWFNFAFD